MGLTLLLFCVLTLLYSAANGVGLKILVHPLQGGFTSRLANMEKMANMLIERGHEVYFLVNDFHKTCANCKLSPKAKRLYYSGPGTDVDTFEEIVWDVMNKPIYNGQYDTYINNQAGYCEHFLKEKGLIQQIKTINFDLLFADVNSHCGKIIKDYLDKPFVVFSNWGLDSNPDIAWDRWPSYMLTMASTSTDLMNFWQRLDNLFAFLMLDCYLYAPFFTSFQKLREKAKLNTTLQISESYKSASIVFENSDFVWESPRPLMPHIIAINGIEIDAPKQLPKDIQDIYDKSADAGVIVVSFGSLMIHFGKERVKFICEVFKGLRQEVIWRKFGPDFDDIGDIPPNVHFLEWLPQGDMLANNNTRLFITHAGVSSLRETIHHAVPVVAIPLFVDQFKNAALLVDRVKIGVKLDFKLMTKEVFEEAVREVADNEQYKKQALLASKRMRTQLVGPKEKFIFYIEQAAQPGALDHLYPHGFMALNWYQYLMLDICAFILAILLFLLTIAACTVKFILKRFFKKAKVD